MGTGRLGAVCALGAAGEVGGSAYIYIGAVGALGASGFFRRGALILSAKGASGFLSALGALVRRFTNKPPGLDSHYIYIYIE